MGFPARIPRGMMQRKPPHGSPCTHCGACCAAVVCELGAHVFRGTAGPCPALLVDEASGQSQCGLAAIGDDEHTAAALVLISSGDGCDARFNGEPINRAFHAYQASLDQERADAIRSARALWDLPARKET